MLTTYSVFERDSDVRDGFSNWVVEFVHRRFHFNFIIPARFLASIAYERMKKYNYNNRCAFEICCTNVKTLRFSSDSLPFFQQIFSLRVVSLLPPPKKRQETLQQSVFLFSSLHILEKRSSAYSLQTYEKTLKNDQKNDQKFPSLPPKGDAHRSSGPAPHSVGLHRLGRGSRAEERAIHADGTATEGEGRYSMNNFLEYLFDMYIF